VADANKRLRQGGDQANNLFKTFRGGTLSMLVLEDIFYCDTVFKTQL
jgi:hypothetical protein